MTEHFCNQDGRISRIETSVEALTVKFSEFLTEFRSFKVLIEPFVEKVDEHDEVLYGEKGKSGMIATVEHTNEIVLELHAALKGKEKEPGLIAEIKTLNENNSKVADTSKWLFRLVLGAIVTGIIGLIWTNFGG